MNRTRFLALAAASLLAIAIGAAVAHAATVNTTIEIRDLDTNDPHDATASGVIDSPRAKCLANRKVKFFKNVNNDHFVLLDTDRTSKRGAWSARGDIENAFGFPVLKVRVTRKTYNHGNLVCKGDVAGYFS